MITGDVSTIPADTSIMGRIRRDIDVEGEPRWTLFDSGARNSHIRRAAIGKATTMPTSEMRKSALGGRTHEVDTICVVRSAIEGHTMEFLANVVEEIGTDEDGREIDVLFGAIAMQHWGIKLDPPNERLDLTHFADDFVEF